MTLAQVAMPVGKGVVIPIELTPRGGTTGDSDGDSVPDIADLDDDNDGIPDIVEGTIDSDDDGIANCLDLDSDNDGLSDLFEAISSPGLLSLLDSDGNGQIDASVAVGANGLADLVEDSPESGTTPYGTEDLDGDGVADHQDLDVDNDGIPDIIEAGSSDNNMDGRYDLFLDLNGDGYADRLFAAPISVRDTDNDGIADFRDIDSDQDGLTDRLETFGIDTDSDGRVDDFVDLDVDGLHDAYINMSVSGYADSDQDGFPDYRDTDSDGDGLTDAEEAFNTTVNSEPIVPSTPFNPRPNQSAQAADITLETGESGSVFGCAIAPNPYHATSRSTGSNRGTDPMFVVLLVVSIGVLLTRVVGKARSLARASTLLFALFLSACATQPRPGASSTQFTPYAGVGLGGSFLNANTKNLPLTQDQSFSPAGQLTLGTTINHRLALEARAADLGEATFTNGRAVGYQVADVSVLYKQRFDKLSGFGRFGVGALFNDGDIQTTQKNATHLLVGLGVDYPLSSQLAMRAEWQGHDADVMHGQLSLLYSFGTPPVRKPVVFAKREAEPVAVDKKDDFQSVPTKPVEPIADLSKAPVAKSKPVPAPIKVPVPAAPAKPPKPPAPPKLPAPPAKPAVSTVDNTAKLPVTDTVPANKAQAASEALDIETVPDDRLAMVEPAVNTLPVPDITKSPQKGRLKPLITVPVEKKSPPPRVDSDNDGIVDASDKCPNTTDGTAVLADGCSLFGDSVPGLSFVPDTDRLTASAEKVLDTVADALSDESDIRVTVAAHTAPADDANAAMFLTRRRTIAIIRYLSDKGIDATRLRPEAFGDTQPLADVTEPSENERVVLTLR